MRIRVDEIPEAGLDLQMHWDSGWLRQRAADPEPGSFDVVQTIEANLRVTRETDHVLVRGTVSGVLQLECGRCLQPFQWDLDTGVEAYLVPEAESCGRDEVELQADDLAYEFFDGEEIDVDQLVAEQIFLAVPVKPLCEEGCAGICPGCGVDLNREECTCERKAEDSPFAILKKLKE